MKLGLISFSCIAAGAILFASCDKAPPTRVQAVSLGQSAVNGNSERIYNYGGHAIRIDDGTAVLRMFLISGGVKTQEFEQVLDSSKHPMSWVTPRVSGSDVEIEFGFLEQDGNSERLGTFAHVTFDSPHLVGSNTRHSSLRVENNQKVLFYYWVKREEGVSFSVAEELSDSVRLKTSEEKPVDFLVVTIANQ